MVEQIDLLLVEDDVSLAQWVSEYLVEQGFVVDHVERGDLVLTQVDTKAYQLILLDVMLPGLSGVEVCRQIRQNSQVPIIMLTARADEFDEVIGLEMGANDYVIKPVRPRALLARIKSVLRTVQTKPIAKQESNKLVFGDLSIDSGSKRVIYEGNEIEISTSLFDFLWFLASHAGEIQDRDSVFKALRGREYDGLDRRFDVMLSNLRKLFNDDPQKPTKFKTIWGKGYLFIADAWQKK